MHSLSVLLSSEVISKEHGGKSGSRLHASGVLGLKRLNLKAVLS